ncbi:MAG: hypothetical protein IPP86_00260 [Bacteroidetes bacterium]|nr:hypothetical protein [Bacteroidota bacterium]
MRAENKKIWFQPLDIKDRLDEIKRTGNSRGKSTGFSSLDDHMTLMLRTTLYFYGAPFSGKSEIIYDLLIYCIQVHGWRVAIFSPESGSKEEILAEIISKVNRRPFYKNQDGNVSEDQMYRTVAELQDKLVIIDPGYNDITPDQFYELIDEAEKQTGKIQVTVIDPWNELKHDFGKANRQDLYLEEKLGLIRRNAQEKNRLNIVSTHVADQMYVQDGNSRFYPVASPREIAGGQAWYRKGMNMISVWRPPFGLNDESGRPYEENEVHLVIQKYKPKGVGKRGTCTLYFDKYSNRYYEKIDEVRRFPAS